MATPPSPVTLDDTDSEWDDDTFADDSDVTTTVPARAGRAASIEMLISSAISLIASFVLSVDALIIAANPAAELSCNINAKISCGAVAASAQANLFGFPNAFLGLMAEPVVITIAILGIARVVFPTWFMRAAHGVYTLGLIFALWLLWQSYFEIHRLCPWCLAVTVTTILVWTSMTRIMILDGHWGARVKRSLAPALSYHVDVVLSVLFIAVLAAAVVLRYA